ncbi:MAG: hypothetical protein ACFFDU_10260 [Candidatus Thorarchaeota archaeon]
MPAVYYIARQLNRQQPGELIDYILVLWLYSNPHETRRRSLASLRNVLKHIPEFQRPDGKPNVTDKELNQIIFAALQRLKERGIVTVFTKTESVAQISLTEKGSNFIQSQLSVEQMQYLEEAGHIT